MASFLFGHAWKISSSTKLLKTIQLSLNAVNPNIGDSVILNLHHGMVLFLRRCADLWKDWGQLERKGLHKHKYDKEDGQESQIKIFDITGIQMAKCLLWDVALGIIHDSRINPAKGIGEIDNWEHVTQPCFLHPNLAVITQLSLETRQAMCQQRGMEQRMWMLTALSPASGGGRKHIKALRSLILPTTSPIIKLPFYLKLTLKSSDRDSVPASPTFENLFF